MGNINSAEMRTARRWLEAAALCLLLLMITVQPALAGQDIARWVDQDGVTHFGDAQYAPASAEPVAIQPTNGMDVPVNTATSGAREDGPAWSVISRAPKRNVKGWRSRGESLYTGRKHGRNRRR